MEVHKVTKGASSVNPNSIRVLLRVDGNTAILDAVRINNDGNTGVDKTQRDEGPFAVREDCGGGVGSQVKADVAILKSRAVDGDVGAQHPQPSAEALHRVHALGTSAGVLAKVARLCV